jgi:hypothetical protein
MFDFRVYSIPPQSLSQARLIPSATFPTYFQYPYPCGTLLFWVITQQVVVITDISGQPVGLILRVGILET